MTVKTWQTRSIETITNYGYLPAAFEVQKFMADEIEDLRGDNAKLLQSLKDATKVIGELTYELGAMPVTGTANISVKDTGAAPKDAKPGAEKPKTKWASPDTLEETLIEIFGADRVVFLG